MSEKTREAGWIEIHKAKENNLKNISLKIPRESFTVVTGISGSGKSSLVFDVIYAEAMRRYSESMNVYTRLFLEKMKKPLVEKIEGLSPAISIDQKISQQNPRSTVGTITEIYDYLRLLYARTGDLYCYKCHSHLKTFGPSQIALEILKNDNYKEVQILSAFEKEKFKSGLFLNELKEKGFYRVYLNKDIIDLSYNEDAEKFIESIDEKFIFFLIDRLPLDKKFEERIIHSIETAFKESQDQVSIRYLQDKKEKLSQYSQRPFCFKCQIHYEKLEPKIFSFNSPYGACLKCSGVGENYELDVDSLIKDPSLSIWEGGIRVIQMNNSWYKMQFETLARHYKFSLKTPIKDIDKKIWHKIIYGSEDDLIEFSYIGRGNKWTSQKIPYEGIVPMMQRKYREKKYPLLTEEYKKYMKSVACQECQGKRLNKKALSILFQNKDIGSLSQMSIEELISFLNNINLPQMKLEIAEKILKEIKERLSFLKSLGLDYLSLSRSAESLSGGEIQRIRLARQIGSKLMGVLYILDEPTIGLHEKDNEKLIQSLIQLKKDKNTLILVEHDKQSILKSDYMIDIGPYSGAKGGEVIAEGKLSDLLKNPKGLTLEYLTNKKKIFMNKTYPIKEDPDFIKVESCFLHNLKNIDVRIPLNQLTIITGVSGSGKSSLMNKTLYPALRDKLDKNFIHPQKYYKSISGTENLDKVLFINQSPIGRTPRSNPVTYTGIFDLIRHFFSSLEASKIMGYKPGRFSFNVKGGRCENCQGDGNIKVEMHFLPDIYVLCDVCKGKRYNSQTLQIKYKNKSISDVLDMTFEEAVPFFDKIAPIQKKLKIFKELGLSHLKLGQSALSLSGGEAQRIKLTNEIAKRRHLTRYCYLLDEPTTGLHFEDIQNLLKVINRLIEKGNTVVIIEHHTDFIRQADYIIDLGPGSGENGGKVIAEGSLEEILKNKNSIIRKYL